MINKAILLGNLGKDPVLRRTESGVPVATFSVATSETYKDKDGIKQEKTEWHNVVLWRGLAEIAEKFLKKGDKVYIEGKIVTRSYEQEGQTKYITEIVGAEMKLLSPKGTGSGSYQEAPLPSEEPYTSKAPESSKTMVSEETDDLPF
jgi:single-strand DNA-binding protein